MIEVELSGCTPEPMMSYLKALGILRLVAEQVDLQARGFWRNGSFHLHSSLDEDALIDFFLHQYKPTPLVAPWLGGSGFYEGDNTQARDSILASDDSRLEGYREAIREIFAWPELPPTCPTVARMIRQMQQHIDGMRAGKAQAKLTELTTAVRDAFQHTTEPEHPTVPGLSLDKSIQENEQAFTAWKKGQRQVKGRMSSEAKEPIAQAKKLRSQCKSLWRSSGKEQIVLACRSRLSDEALLWVDAAVMVGRDSSLASPPILGTGGNEGHQIYSNTFMGHIAYLLIQESNSRPLLEQSFFARPTSGLQVSPAGQYNPGRAGGFNQGTEIETKKIPVNPWDFVFSMEGCLAWVSSIGRRLGIQRGKLSSSFTVAARDVGYSSASERDKQAARAEIWMPLWNRPARYAEIRAFLAEGRAEVGRKQASHGLEFAEAVASLGTDRGVSEFVRYSLLKRRGKSGYVALPAGHFPVQARRESDLVRELDKIFARLDRFLRSFPKGNVPAQYGSYRRQIDSAIYELLLRGGSGRIKHLLAVIGQFEKALGQRDIRKKPQLSAPLLGIHPRWIAAADDGSVEIRLAASLASISARGGVGPIRANLEPVDPSQPWSWAESNRQDTWQGATLCERLAGVLQQRMMDADRLDCTGNPLWGSIALHALDIMQLMEGTIDEELVENLLFGMSWVRWNAPDAKSAFSGLKWQRPAEERRLSRPWALLKLLFWPKPLTLADKHTPVQVRPEPSIVPLLRAGRINEACRIAQRRLYSAGLNPIRCEFPDGVKGTRLAAALLVPCMSLRLISRKVLEETNH